MKYCAKCGTEISDDRDLCADCDKVNVDLLQGVSVKQSKKCSVLSIIAFAISIIVFVYVAFFTVEFFIVEELGILVIALLLLIPGIPGCLISSALSITAVCLTVKTKRRGKGLAIASLVVSILSICAVLSAVIWMRLIPALSN